MITSLPDPAKGVLYHVNNNSVVHVDDLLASSAYNTVKFVPTTYACCDVTTFAYRARDGAHQYSDIQYFLFIYCGQIIWFLVFISLFILMVSTSQHCVYIHLSSQSSAGCVCLFSNGGRSWCVHTHCSHCCGPRFIWFGNIHNHKQRIISLLVFFIFSFPSSFGFFCIILFWLFIHLVFLPMPLATLFPHCHTRFRQWAWVWLQQVLKPSTTPPPPTLSRVLSSPSRLLTPNLSPRHQSPSPFVSFLLLFNFISYPNLFIRLPKSC